MKKLNKKLKILVGLLSISIILLTYAELENGFVTKSILPRVKSFNTNICGFTNKDMKELKRKGITDNEIERYIAYSASGGEVCDLLNTVLSEENTDSLDEEDSSESDQEVIEEPILNEDVFIQDKVLEEENTESVDEENKNELDQEATDYITYINTRFGFSIEHPTTFTEIEIPENNDGREFMNQEASIHVVGYYINIFEDNETIETYYNRELESVYNEIAYQRLGDSWYVISYSDGDDIIYKKGIIGENIISELTITYPANKQDDYETMVTRVAESFIGGTVG